MLIRILGFEWNVSEGLSLAEFYYALVAISAQQQTVLAKMLADGIESVPVGLRPDKIICVDRSGPLWKGMFIKLRSARSFMTVVRQEAVLHLTAEQLQQNKAMAEVNFFVINEVTGRGLYQHYHQSTYLDGFCCFCHDAYDRAVLERRKVLQKQAAEEVISLEILKQQLARLKHTLTYAVMVRKEKFEALVSELEQINAVELVLSSKKVTRAEYQPLSDWAMRQSVRYVFGRQGATRREKIKSAVMNAVEALSSERKARVVGMLPGKLARVFDLEENYDVLGELDYDKTAKDLEINFSNLQNSLAGSAFIKKLTEIANRPDVKARLEAPLE